MQRFSPSIVYMYLALVIVISACEGEQDGPGECLEEPFTVTAGTKASVFTFTADTRRDDVLYYWYIDDVLAGDAGNHIFSYDFLLDTSGNVPGGPGEYTICLSVVSPGCEQGTIRYCETITVEQPASTCPTANFDTAQEEPGTFKFTSNFQENGLFYWYIDDILSGDAGNPIFTYNFLQEGTAGLPNGPGEYEICLKITTEDCPQGTEQYCETITVEAPADPCAQVTFTTDETAPKLYRFESQSNAPGTLYYWYLNGRLSGDAARDYFEYDFSQNPANTATGAGEYEICLKTLTPSCPDGSELYCETVKIAAENGCPSAVFETKNVQGSVYKFTSSFEQGIYYWYINGKLAGDAGSNVFQYDFLLSNDPTVPGGPGSYDICLRIITSGCVQGSELYCTTIAIK